MEIILFDHPLAVLDLLPFTFTRPVAQIRLGILTISEKWEKSLPGHISYKTQPHLEVKYGKSAAQGVFINGGLCPDEKLISTIKNLQPGECLMKEGALLAYNGSEEDFNKVLSESSAASKIVEFAESICLISYPWHIFKNNGAQIRADFALLTAGRTSQKIDDPHTIVYGLDNIFIEEGAKIRAAVINAENGPVYIGKDAEVQEGALIRGPFALGEHSVVNMGAKMRGDNTIGPFCKVGGEVSNSILFGYSNKGHDGFIGNTVIGEWCNLGADTNTSNLKNNYAPVRLWSYRKKGFAHTQEQFCGLMMGDHSKCGINTMFNTGTVVGVGSNIFGPGFPRNFIPSFAWGGAQGFSTFKLDKMFETAGVVMGRRGLELSDADKAILQYVYDEMKPNRYWE